MPRPFAFLLLQVPLLLLLRVWPAACEIADGQCPMNASEPAPEGAYQVHDVLWAGKPERSYPSAAYRQVRGGGYRLCTCETGQPCVRKCCAPNAAYKQMRCTAHNVLKPVVSFEIPKFVNANGTVDAHATGQFHIVNGKLACAKKYQMPLPQENNDNFRVNEVGWLLDESGSVIAYPDKFCLEQFYESNYQVLPVVCYSEAKEEEVEELQQSGTMFSTIAMILSLPFLFSTFLVYALIKDLQNMHGKSLMCHVATLLIAYTSLIVIQFITNGINDEWCVVLAHIMTFSFMASFFWLNVMCFDLWWAFSGFRPLRGNLKEHEAKKFIIYSIYAWGCTSLISIITFFMDKLTFLPSGVIRPEIGKNKCFFDTKEATLLYFYGPIGILLFSNLMMFIHTAIQIIKHMRDAHVFKGSESQRNVNHEKQRFMLYLKLFIVMGVNWLAEIISWKYESKWFIVTDISNSLQGVFIFLIFVCKKRVLRLLSQKLCPQFKLFNLSNTASTRTTNSNFSRTSHTRNNDTVEMSTNDTENSVHDFRA